MEEEEAPPPNSLSSSARRPPRSSHRNTYDLPETSEESIAQTTAVQEHEVSQAQLDTTAESVAQASSAAKSAVPPQMIEPEVQETLPDAPSFQSLQRTRRSATAVEEIEESPVYAPGSGRRRSVQVSDALPSSSRLHDALNTDEEVPQSSSPLAQKARRSSMAAPPRSARSSRRQSSRLIEQTDADELSPDRSREQVQEEDEFEETRSREE